jgi:hypothetical protein
MNILSVIAIVFSGIIALLFLTGLVIKNEYVVAREVIINKPKTTVFEYISLLKNQNEYSFWATMDPNMKKKFRGVDGTAGFVSLWESENKNVGKGEQEILKVTSSEKIDYEIRFIKPFKSTSYASMTAIYLSENQTKVQWVFNGKMKYPMNLMLLFMNMETMIGIDLEKGLQKLKTILDK